MIELLQCAKSSCGHVMLKYEQDCIPHPDWECAILCVCPKCGKESFYTLNAQGQKRKQSDPSPREFDPNEINPSPKMGLKMRRRILAAKRRAIAAITK